MQDLHLEVKKEDKGLRLDQYISKTLGQAIHGERSRRSRTISRSRIQRLIKEGLVLVNQRRARAHYKVKERDLLFISIPEPLAATGILPEDIPLEIVFEDDDILVINKPTGLTTHPASGHYSHTLVNALLHYGCSLSTINGPLRPGIVHRLDKDTSGVMVVAKNDFAHLDLAEQFRRHSVKRKYIAIVKGRLEHDQGIIDYPLSRDPQNRLKMKVDFQKKSKQALTRFKVLKRYNQATVVELFPHTGRTHQLRVHLNFLGHPILGDARYGKRGQFKRLKLHAKVLGFQHPRTNKFIEFHSQLPQCFSDIIE
jgi:23S rRNA pseudouridine1911/1915/1917 synthase